MRCKQNWGSRLSSRSNRSNRLGDRANSDSDSWIDRRLRSSRDRINLGSSFRQRRAEAIADHIDNGGTIVLSQEGCHICVNRASAPELCKLLKTLSTLE
jgi:hypothetical protein